jgi:hypothetical protein
MDVNRLNQGEKIAAGSGVVLFIAMFLSWFGAPSNDFTNALGAAGVDTTLNAWQSFDFIDLFLLLTAVVAVGAAAAKAADARVDFPLSSIVTVLGAISTILVLYRIIDPPGSLDRKFGVFLGLILAALLTYGGWLAMQDEGASFGDAADRLGGDRASGAGGGDHYATPREDDPYASPPPASDEPPSAPPPPPPPPPSGGAPPSA